jgi:hypothetical protein
MSDPETGSKDDSHSPIWLSLRTVILAFATFSLLWSMAGLGALAQGPKPAKNTTLADYGAIENISVENGTFVVRLPEGARFEQVSDTGEKRVTHVGLVKEDGRLSQKKPLSNGQKAVRIKLPENKTTGNYTLSIYNYRPPNPGLFGYSEKWYSQGTVISINRNNTVTIEKLPYAARYPDEPPGPLKTTWKLLSN